MKKVIYTSLTGGYDTLLDPSIVFKDWDYICFSDYLKQEDFKVWKILPIPFSYEDNVIKSRYVKFFPHLAMPEYEISLFIDANISITSELLYSHLDSLLKKNDINIAIARHPARSCIYDEALACLKEGRAKISDIKRHIAYLRKENFPANYGLHENGIILRKHHYPAIIEVNKLWWDVFLNYAKRDQLSLEYALWKKNVSCDALFNNGFDVRESHLFSYKLHELAFKKKLQIKIRRNINKFILFLKRDQI